jgi:hypothetical protein
MISISKISNIINDQSLVNIFIQFFMHFKLTFINYEIDDIKYKYLFLNNY